MLKFLQNSSNAFGYVATPSNYIAPGKRPLSSISPAIIEDKQGNFIFATGAAGGSRIIGANFQIIHHYIDQGLTPRKFLISLYSLPWSPPDEISTNHYPFSTSKHVAWLLEQAINSPRLHDQIFPTGTLYENGSLALDVPAYPGSNVAYLASLGHKVQPTSPGLSIAASIGYKDGKFDAASDPRIPGSGAVVV